MTNKVNNWTVMRLDQVATVTMGQSPPSSSYNTEGAGVPFLQGTPPVVDAMGAAVPSQWTTQPTKVVEAGTALMTVRAPVGELFTSNDTVCLGRGLAGIKANNDVSQNYLNYYLKFAKDQFASVSQGSTFTAINSADLKGIGVSLPSYQNQEYFGKILLAIDQDIAKTYQIIQRTENLKQGIIAGLFEKGRKNSAWRLVKLNTITTKVTDGTHKTPKYIEDGIPFLRINDIRNHEINWSKTKYISKEEHNELIKRCKPEKGDILLSKNGTIGITKIVTWDREFSIFVSLCLIKPNLELVLSEYLGIVIGSDYVLSQAKKRSKQGTVTNLHLEEIRDFDIPLPSKADQEKIIVAVSAIDSKLNSETQQKEKLIKLKQGLMYDIFNQKVQIN